MRAPGLCFPDVCQTSATPSLPAPCSSRCILGTDSSFVHGSSSGGWRREERRRIDTRRAQQDVKAAQRPTSVLPSRALLRELFREDRGPGPTCISNVGDAGRTRQRLIFDLLCQLRDSCLFSFRQLWSLKELPRNRNDRDECDLRQNQQDAGVRQIHRHVMRDVWLQERQNVMMAGFHLAASVWGSWLLPTVWNKEETPRTVQHAVDWLSYWIPYGQINEHLSLLSHWTTVQEELRVRSLVASGGSVVALHPAFGSAQRIGLLHRLVLRIYTPVLAAFKDVYVTICPCEGSVSVAGETAEESFGRFGIRAEVCGVDFIPLPVPRALK